MSTDKAFDKFHKRFRYLDRNDARIAWDAGREEERRASNTATAAPGDLPPLPEKIGTIYPGNYWTGKNETNIFSMAIAEVVTLGQCREYGRACIARNAGAAPGWQTVPKEPTEAMVHAAEDLPAPRMFAKVYRAMLAAAPSNPPVGAHERKEP